MRLEGEAFLDPVRGRWYGVISIVTDDGPALAVLTPPRFKTRSGAELAMIPLLRRLKEFDRRGSRRCG